MVFAKLRKTASFFLTRTRVPEYLYLDITSICNSNCIFCAYQYDTREKVIMNDWIFKKSVDEYKKMGGENISLTPILGEALIDPKIIEKLEYLKSEGFKQIHFYTNMTLLHKFDVDRFMNSGVTALYISTAPCIEEDYTRIYRTGKYPVVLKNIRTLLKSFRSKGKRTLKSINIGFRSNISLEECTSTSDFKKYIAPYLGDNVSLHAMRSFDSWNGAITKADLLEGMTIKSPDFLKILPCERLFIVHVMVNGDIRLCGCRYNPFNRKDELVLGNIRNESIAEIYNSKAVSTLIGGFLRNSIPEVCEKCSWYE